MICLAIRFTLLWSAVLTQHLWLIIEVSIVTQTPKLKTKNKLRVYDSFMQQKKTEGGE